MSQEPMPTWWRARCLKRGAEDSVVIAAENIRRNDVFDFAGATLRAESISYFDPIVEIEAVGPFGLTTIHYLKFEGVKVFFPRPEVPE